MPSPVQRANKNSKASGLTFLKNNRYICVDKAVKLTSKSKKGTHKPQMHWSLTGPETLRSHGHRSRLSRRLA